MAQTGGLPIRDSEGGSAPLRCIFVAGIARRGAYGISSYSAADAEYGILL